MLRDIQVVFQVPFHKVHYPGIRHLERIFLLESPPKIDLGESRKIIVELNAGNASNPGLREMYGFATYVVDDFDNTEYERLKADAKQDYVLRQIETGVIAVLQNHGLDYGWVSRVAERIRKNGYAATYASKPKLSKSRGLKAEVKWEYAAADCKIFARVGSRKAGIVFEGTLARGLSTREMEGLVRAIHWNGERLVCGFSSFSFGETEAGSGTGSLCP